MAMNVQIVGRDENNTLTERSKITDGALHTINGVAPANFAQNRIVTAVDSTMETVTWPSPVKEIQVTVIQEAAGTANLTASIGIVFDAPSDLAATTWLTYVETKTSDSNLYAVRANETKTFYFNDNGIVRVDLKRLFGSEALGVILEAV